MIKLGFLSQETKVQNNFHCHFHSSRETLMLYLPFVISFVIPLSVVSTKNASMTTAFPKFWVNIETGQTSNKYPQREALLEYIKKKQTGYSLLQMDLEYQKVPSCKENKLFRIFFKDKFIGHEAKNFSIKESRNLLTKHFLEKTSIEHAVFKKAILEGLDTEQLPDLLNILEKPIPLQSFTRQINTRVSKNELLSLIFYCEKDLTYQLSKSKKEETLEIFKDIRSNVPQCHELVKAIGEIEKITGIDVIELATADEILLKMIQNPNRILDIYNDLLKGQKDKLIIYLEENRRFIHVDNKFYSKFTRLKTFEEGQEPPEDDLMGEELKHQSKMRRRKKRKEKKVSQGEQTQLSSKNSFKSRNNEQPIFRMNDGRITRKNDRNLTESGETRGNGNLNIIRANRSTRSHTFIPRKEEQHVFRSKTQSNRLFTRDPRRFGTQKFFDFDERKEFVESQKESSDSKEDYSISAEDEIPEENKAKSTRQMSQKSKGNLNNVSQKSEKALNTFLTSPQVSNLSKKSKEKKESRLISTMNQIISQQKTMKAFLGKSDEKQSKRRIKSETEISNITAHVMGKNMKDSSNRGIKTSVGGDKSSNIVLENQSESEASSASISIDKKGQTPKEIENRRSKTSKGKNQKGISKRKTKESHEAKEAFFEDSNESSSDSYGSQSRGNKAETRGDGLKSVKKFSDQLSPGISGGYQEGQGHKMFTPHSTHKTGESTNFTLTYTSHKKNLQETREGKLTQRKEGFSSQSQRLGNSRKSDPAVYLPQNSNGARVAQRQVASGFRIMTRGAEDASNAYEDALDERKCFSPPKINMDQVLDNLPEAENEEDGTAGQKTGKKIMKRLIFLNLLKGIDETPSNIRSNFRAFKALQYVSNEIYKGFKKEIMESIVNGNEGGTIGKSLRRSQHFLNQIGEEKEKNFRGFSDYLEYFPQLEAPKNQTKFQLASPKPLSNGKQSFGGFFRTLQGFSQDQGVPRTLKSPKLWPNNSDFIQTAQETFQKPARNREELIQKTELSEFFGKNRKLKATGTKNPSCLSDRSSQLEKKKQFCFSVKKHSPKKQRGIEASKGLSNEPQLPLPSDPQKYERNMVTILPIAGITPETIEAVSNRLLSIPKHQSHFYYLGFLYIQEARLTLKELQSKEQIEKLKETKLATKFKSIAKFFFQKQTALSYQGSNSKESILPFINSQNKKMFFHNFATFASSNRISTSHF